MKLTRREAIKSAVAGLALGATPSAQAQEPGSGTNSISAPQPGIPPSSPQAPHLQQTCYSIPLNEDEDDAEEHYIVLALAFSTDSNTLAPAKADGTVRLWDVNAEAVERRYHPSYVAARNRNRSVRYEPVCKTMQILQRTAFPPVKKYDESVPSIAFSSDLKTLAFGAIDDCVKLCDLNTGKICGSLLLPKDRWFDIGRMVFSPDRKMLAATVGHTPCREGSSRIEPPWEAIVWDLTTGNQIYAVPKVEPSTLQFLP